jgi:carbamate kinase
MRDDSAALEGATGGAPAPAAAPSGRSPGLAVVAIGGNSITRRGQVGTIPEQYANARETCRHLARLVEDGWSLVLTHGNGPQVGMVLLRVQLSMPQVYPLPLDVCDSDTQGGMGYMIQQLLGNELRARGIARPVATLVTQVVVDRADPAFERPSKPIGRFYDALEAEARRKEQGWVMVEDAGRGFRRVVASPRPREVVEIEAVRALVRAGVVVIAAGGGGIPVVREGTDLVGVEAVVDKDRSSALLATALGARLLLITTGVDRVHLDWGTPRARPLARMTVSEGRRRLAEGQFPPGSMGPKVEAVCDFLEAPGGPSGREALITAPDRVEGALLGEEGTRISVG